MHKAFKLLLEDIKQKSKLKDIARTKNKHDPKFSEINYDIT